MKKSIALIFGGEGYEHDISVASAENLASLIDAEMYNIIYIVIDKEGNWYIYSRRDGEPLSLWKSEMQRLRAAFPIRLFGVSGIYSEGNISEICAAIPCLHGDFGEDGSIYGTLAAAHIPYIGQNCHAAAFASDKSISKLVADRLSIPTARWLDFKFGNSDIRQRAEREIEYPMFIKPTRLGSSYGAHPVFSRDEFEPALRDAFSYSENIIIEEYINFAYEVECAYFDGEEKLFSPHGRILSGKFYDFSAKYNGEDESTDTKCDFDPEAEMLIEEYSKRLTDALGLRYLSRIDFFVTDKKEVYFNEINTFPGMTKTSLYPALSENMGLRRGEFINILIEKAINDRRI